MAIPLVFVRVLTRSGSRKEGEADFVDTRNDGVSLPIYVAHLA